MTDTLINPIWQKYRFYIIGAGLLVILGIVLFTFQYCDTWRFERKQDKLKANVNATLANIKEREAVIANLKEQQAADKARVEVQAKELLEATSATDEARQETDKVLDKLANVNSNTNISVSELEEKLKNL